MLSDEFVMVFGVWDEAVPYLSLMVHEDEMRLVLALRDGELPFEAIAELLPMGVDQAANLVQRAYRRHLVDKTLREGQVAYSAGSFYGFLDHFAKFENWDDIPILDRHRIDRRFLDAFIDRHRANVQRKMEGLEAENALPNDTVLLVNEVEEMIDAATHIVVQPCDCRRLGQYCSRPVETCIWLDDGALAALDRGYGRRLTRDEAKDLVRRADRAGLMHTADSEWRTRGLHAICNCCACDCYPFRAARELGSGPQGQGGIWPRSRYIAAYDPDRCNLCGTCVVRCHFEAFYHGDSLVTVGEKLKQSVLFDPARCWGCGLCASTCPSGAIEMVPLA